MSIRGVSIVIALDTWRVIVMPPHEGATVHSCPGEMDHAPDHASTHAHLLVHDHSNGQTAARHAPAKRERGRKGHSPKIPAPCNFNGRDTCGLTSYLGSTYYIYDV